MSLFKDVLRIFEARKYKLPQKKKKPIVWQAWMKKSDNPAIGWFWCERLNFTTQPVICVSRRNQLQHPTQETCKACPLGDKIESQTCVGSHGQYAFCKSCPDKVGCKNVTGLIHNPTQVSSPLSVRVAPAQESTVAKQKAEQKSNKKGKPAEEEEEEDEDIEEEEEDTEEEDTEDEDEDEEEDEEDEEEEDDAPAPAKGKKDKKAKKGGGKKGGLVPREPVKVPAAVLKAASPEVKKLLKERQAVMEAGGDDAKDKLRKIRAGLRKHGFNLSKLNQAE